MLLSQGVLPATCKSVQHTFLARAPQTVQPACWQRHAAALTLVTVAVSPADGPWRKPVEAPGCSSPVRVPAVVVVPQATVWVLLNVIGELSPVEALCPGLSDCQRAIVIPKRSDTTHAGCWAQEGSCQHHWRHHTPRLRQCGRYQLISWNTSHVCSLNCCLLGFNSVTLQGSCSKNVYNTHCLKPKLIWKSWTAQTHLWNVLTLGPDMDNLNQFPLLVISTDVFTYSGAALEPGTHSSTSFPTCFGTWIRYS